MVIQQLFKFVNVISSLAEKTYECTFLNIFLLSGDVELRDGGFSGKARNHAPRAAVLCAHRVDRGNQLVQFLAGRRLCARQGQPLHHDAADAGHAGVGGPYGASTGISRYFGTFYGTLYVVLLMVGAESAEMYRKKKKKKKWKENRDRQKLV